MGPYGWNYFSSSQRDAMMVAAALAGLGGPVPRRLPSVAGGGGPAPPLVATVGLVAGLILMLAPGTRAGIAGAHDRAIRDRDHRRR